jgi:predicted nucleic acid-binding protein
VTIVDASIGVKWFLDEAGSPDAKQLLVSLVRKIVVPDIFPIEVVSALVRNANIDKAARPVSEASIKRFSHIFETDSIRAVRLNMHHVERASGFAMDIGHPLKDCLYLALAMELGCPLITADARFAEKAKRVYDGVRVLGER